MIDLDELTERWRGPLVGYLASQGAGWEEAVELSLDCFAEAWLGRSRFRGESGDLEAVGAWLRGIARNVWRARLRQRRRSGREIATIRLDSMPAEDAADADRRERAEQVHRAIERLGSEHRALLNMHYFEQTTHRVVGALLGISERAVEGRLRRARMALKQELDRSSASAARSSDRSPDRSPDRAPGAGRTNTEELRR